MIKNDSHLHTTLSHDGISSIDEYIETLQDSDINEITFTEHLDIYDGLPSNLETMDLINYRKVFNIAKENYPDAKINFGIEVGLRPEYETRIKKMLDHNHFDFVIGSSHITSGKDIGQDHSFFDGLSQKEAYMQYFNEIIKNIEVFSEYFDVYGHIDYIIRYGGYENKFLNYQDYKDILDAILSALIKKDKGIEINTSGYRYGIGSPHPNEEIIKRYKELGGKIITVGSDAHKTSDLGKDFNKVEEILLKNNIGEVAIYKNRVPEFVKVLK